MPAVGMCAPALGFQGFTGTLYSPQALTDQCLSNEWALLRIAFSLCSTFVKQSKIFSTGSLWLTSTLQKAWSCTNAAAVGRPPVSRHQQELR